MASNFETNDTVGETPQASFPSEEEGSVRSAPPAETETEASRLRRMEDSLAALHRTVIERLQYDEAKEQAFNRLYADLDAHRKQLAGEPLKPLLRDLVSFYDHLMASRRHAPESAGTLDLLREGLLEVLYRADVEPLETSGGRFDRSTQSIQRVEWTGDPARDWTVAEVLKDGFRFGASVLRPQHVAVWRYRQDAPAPESEGQ